MNNNDKPLSDNDMKNILKNHVRISFAARERIAGRLFEKLEEKKSESTPQSPSRAGSYHITWPIALAASIALISGIMLILTYSTVQHPEMAAVVGFWNNCKIVRGSQELAKIEIGTKLKAGDLLITGSDSGMRIKTGDGSLVSLGRCSELECTAPRGKGRYTFNLHCGSILAEVSHDAKRLFSVKTPDALLKVLGTEFEAKVSGGVPSQNKENDKMKSSTMKKTATLTALTVLTGAVAVTPLHAAETVVKSGSTASISASGGTTVDPVKVQSFIKNVIKGNYEKNSNVWLDADVGSKGLLGSIYKFNADTGKAEKVADAAGLVYVESQFNGGALISVHGILLKYFTISNNNGCPIVSNSLMMIANNGECLDLEFLVKYSPWYPALSPDGLKLAFLGHERSGTKYIGGLYVLDFRTMAVKQIFTGDLKTIPAWSSDSSKVIISKNEGYTVQHKMVIIDADSGKVADTGFNGCSAVCSNDGKRIAYPGEFTKGGSWYRGVPNSGNIFLADYPDGKPVKLTSIEKDGAIMPSFSPDGKLLAYFSATARVHELHLINLNTNDDRLIYSIPKNMFVNSSKWTDNAVLMLGVSDSGSAVTRLKQIDMTSSPAVIKDIEFNFKVDSADSAKAVAELEPAFKLYLAGLQSGCLNRLDEASRNYKDAYAALLKFNDSARNIDPALKLESLAPYLKLFKKLADMPEREFYLKVLNDRLEVLSYLLNSYVAKNKRLPDSMEEYAKFVISYTILSAQLPFKGNSPEAKFVMRMPDEKRDVVTSFELKKLDGNNIEIWSAPLPWGGKLKVRLELKNGHWAQQGETETVTTQETATAVDKPAFVQKTPVVSPGPAKALPESPEMTEAIKKALILRFDDRINNDLILQSGIENAPVNVAFSVYGKREGGNDQWEAFSEFSRNTGDSTMHCSTGYQFFSGLEGGIYRFKFKYVANQNAAKRRECPLDTYYGGTFETDWMTLEVPAADANPAGLADTSSFRVMSADELVRNDQLFNQEWKSFQIRVDKYQGGKTVFVQTSPFKYNPDKPYAAVIRVVELQSTDAKGKVRKAYNVSCYKLFNNTGFPFYGLDQLFPEPGDYQWQRKLYFFSMSGTDMLTEKLATEYNGNLAVGVGVYNQEKAPALLENLQKKYPFHAVELPTFKITASGK